MLALLCLGFAMLAVVPRLISQCEEPLTGPFAAVFGGALLFGILSVIAIRLERSAAYLLVLAVPAFVIAQDWYQQQTLPDALARQCSSLRIR